MGDRLHLRGTTWWAQLPVPPDVQHIFKKKSFQTTTRHKDKRNASIAAASIIAGWQKDVDEARGNPDAVVSKLATLKALDRKERDLNQFVSQSRSKVYVCVIAVLTFRKRFCKLI